MATEYFNDAWRIPNNKNQSLVSNYSMEFDGINDKIDFGDINGFDITDKFSGSCWIYPTAAGNDYILGKEQQSSPYKGYMLYIDSNRKLRFIMAVQYSTNYFGVTVNPSSSAIPYNTWTHLAFTYDGSTNRTGLKLYINSVLGTRSYTGNSTISGSMLDSTVPFQISGRGGSATNGINGKIDQTCMFDYELSASQVATLYGGGTAVTNPMSLSPKPIAYYQLGDQSVSTGPTADYLVPNNSLDGFVFRSVPAQTTAAIPPNTIISNINYTGTPASPSGFTVSFWVKGIGPFGSGQQQLIFDHSATPYTAATAQGVFAFQSGSILLRFGDGTYRYYTIPSGTDFNDWNNIVVYFQPGDRSAGKVWINGGTPLALSVGAGSSYNDFTSGFRLYLNSFNSNVMYFKNYEIDNAGAALLYNNGSPLSNTSTLAQAPDHWWRLNADDTFDSGTSTWTIKDYIGSEDGTSVDMTSNNLVISDLSNTGGAPGYSPYALDFSGITAHLKTYTIPAATNTVTLSAWVKRTGASGSYGGVFGVRNSGGSPAFGLCWQLCFFANDNKIQFRTSPGVGYDYSLTTVTQNDVMPDNTWTHVVGVADGANIKIYINGVLQTDTKTQTDGTLQTPNSNILFGAQGPAGSNPFNGQLSNCARWNIGLTQAEVIEIYNQGVPSNLNTFSGTAPIGWWQIGSNSSFEGNDWTCLDEIGTDYADSGTTAMANNDIVNGVGYSGNGLGTSSIEIVGDAPYSTANGISENMDVLDRTTDVPG